MSQNVTGTDVVDILLAQLGETLNPLVKAAYAAKIQQLIDAGQDTNFAFSIALMNNPTIRNAPAVNGDANVLATTIQTVREEAVKPSFTIAAADTSVEEGQDATWTVTLANAATDGTYSVTLNKTLGGGASDDDIGAISVTGATYDAATGVLTFAPGVTSATVTIPFLADTISPEDGENVSLSLSNPSTNARLGATTSAAVDIIDVPPAQPDEANFTISAEAASVEEGQNATWTVTLGNAEATESYAVTLTLAYQGGASADDIGDISVSGATYDATTGVLTFAPGVTSATISIPFLADVISPEDGEAIVLSLSNPTNGAVLGASTSAPVEIIDVPLGNELTLQQAVQVGLDDLPEDYTIHATTVFNAGAVSVANAQTAFDAVTAILAGAANSEDLDIATLFTWSISDTAANILAASADAVVTDAQTLTLDADETATVAQATALLALENFDGTYYLADTFANLAGATQQLRDDATPGYLLTNDPAVNLGALSPAQIAILQAAINGDAYSYRLEGQTFTLSAADPAEVINGTTEDDTYDATALGSLQDNDIILDPSSADWDVLNATLNVANTQARITNVEEINLLGEFLTIGMNLLNVSNAQELNLATKIAGGTATVTGANSLHAKEINAGQNINTLNVTSLASGTRDTVTVDAGNAKNVSITGNAAGADKYDVTVAKNTTVTLATIDSANDAVRIDFAGGDKNTLTSNSPNNLALTLNAAAEATAVNVTNAAAVLADKIALTGSKDITLETATGASLVGKEITSPTTGTSTIKITGALATGQDFQFAKVDVFQIDAALGGAVATTLNGNTKLNLTDDLGANTLTVDLDSGDAQNSFAVGDGTLRVDFSETQDNAAFKLITNNNVGTLIIQATPDEVTDLDKDENGFNESRIVVNEIDAQNVNTTAVVAMGSADLEIGTLTMADEDVFAASNMTGSLFINNATVGSGNDDGTIVGSKGFNSIQGLSADVWDIQVHSGGSYIDLGAAGATDGSKVTAAGGSNTIRSNDNAVEIVLGAGNDRVTVGEQDTITLGGGANTLTLGIAKDYTNGDILVKDFVKGTDTLVLTGAGVAGATGNIDLSDVTVAQGKYTIGAGTAVQKWEIKLQNNGANLTSKDMRDSIQLGANATANGAFTLADDATKVVAGDKNDFIRLVTDTEADITTGAGRDTVILNVTTGTAATKATVKDFTVGEDKIIVTGAIADDEGVNLFNVTPVGGFYTIGAGNDSAEFRLQNNGADIVTNQNLTGIVQLGVSATDAFIVHSATAAVNLAVTGSQFNDFVSLTETGGDGTATFNFSDNGGVDTVIMVDDNDAKTLVNFNNLAGIDSTAGKTAMAAGAARVNDATDKSVFVFADSSNGTGGAKITTFLTHTANGITQDVINAEVAAFINAALGTSTGEKYVVIINDQSSVGYIGEDWGGSDGQYQYDAYIYLVNGNTTGLTANDITLIGMLDDGTNTAGDTVYTTLDVA